MSRRRRAAPARGHTVSNAELCPASGQRSRERARLSQGTHSPVTVTTMAEGRARRPAEDGTGPTATQRGTRSGHPVSARAAVVSCCVSDVGLRHRLKPSTRAPARASKRLRGPCRGTLPPSHFVFGEARILEPSVVQTPRTRLISVHLSVVRQTLFCQNFQRSWRSLHGAPRTRSTASLVLDAFRLAGKGRGACRACRLSPHSEGAWPAAGSPGVNPSTNLVCREK